jgi:hypothetical protein
MSQINRARGCAHATLAVHDSQNFWLSVIVTPLLACLALYGMAMKNKHLERELRALKQALAQPAEA